MSRSRTIGKERAETRCGADGNTATSHDALLNLVRLLAARPPSLRTALAYQAIFGVPVDELFAGEFQEAVTAVQGRAKQLSRKLEPQADRSKTPFKKKVLASIGFKEAGISTVIHEKEIH